MVKWTVLVPVRGGGRGKSRLPGEIGGVPRGCWVLAFAADTIAAVRRSPLVERVLVPLTLPFPELVAVLESDGAVSAARVSVLEGMPDGLNASILAAAALLGDVRVAVFLGDLPCLRAEDVTGVLSAAEGVRSGVVPDAAGRGSVVLASMNGGLVPRFGGRSFAAHLATGSVELPGSERLRRDVDTVADLGEAVRLGVGDVTSVLARDAGLAFGLA